MIAADRVAVILLAAGRSTRFGARDKLVAPLAGLPLGAHAARTLARLPFATKIVVTSNHALDFAAYGFTSVLNGDPNAGQAKSIRLGVARARFAGPEGILIALADMPFISVRHLQALLSQCGERAPVVASQAGQTRGPPALFAASLFDALEALSGDRGASVLLRDATLVAAPAWTLADVDTSDDLAAAAHRHETL